MAALFPGCSHITIGGVVMISFYTGTPGSGKSYHLAQLVYDKLKYQDINIIANFDINLDNIALTRLGCGKNALQL